MALTRKLDGSRVEETYSVPFWMEGINWGHIYLPAWCWLMVPVTDIQWTYWGLLFPWHPVDKTISRRLKSHIKDLGFLIPGTAVVAIDTLLKMGSY